MKINVNEAPYEDKEVLQLSHTKNDVCSLLADKLSSWLPPFPRDYIVLCIGTDRSTGDSLGPLTGTFFSEQTPTQITTYGTLSEPVHAKNLNNWIQTIQTEHEHPFIIAIDACLGKYHSIGSFIAGRGPLKPGAALSKSLPLIGDIHLTGVVNLAGFMELSVLQNTRLSIVVEMAKKLAMTLKRLDDTVYNYKYHSTNHPNPAKIAEG